MDGNEYVICKICGKKLSRLTKQHFDSHGIIKSEYLAKYPDAMLVSDKCRNAYSSAAKKYLAKKSKAELSEIGRKRANAWWKKFNSDENISKMYRRKLSTSLTQSLKSIKEHDVDRYRQICQSRSIAYQNLYRNPETSERMRNMSRRGGINSWKMKTDNERHEHIKKMTESAKKYWESMSDTERIEFFKHNYSSHKHDCIINGNKYLFRSKFEMTIAKYLADKHVDFEYENKIIKLDNCKYCKYHLIDFYLPYYNTIIEAKSLYHKTYTEDQIREDVKLKKESAEKNGYNYKIIWFAKSDAKIHEELEKIFSELESNNI